MSENYELLCIIIVLYFISSNNNVYIRNYLKYNFNIITTADGSASALHWADSSGNHTGY